MNARHRLVTVEQKTEVIIIERLTIHNKGRLAKYLCAPYSDDHTGVSSQRNKLKTFIITILV